MDYYLSKYLLWATWLFAIRIVIFGAVIIRNVGLFFFLHASLGISVGEIVKLPSTKDLSVYFLTSSF